MGSRVTRIRARAAPAEWKPDPMLTERGTIGSVAKREGILEPVENTTSEFLGSDKPKEDA